MTTTHFAGPLSVGGFPDSNPDAGPSIFWDGIVIADVRRPYNPGVTGPGRIYAFTSNPTVQFVDAAPAPASATGIAPAQTATFGTKLTLAPAASPGIAPGAPVVPFGLSSSAVVKATALDAAFVLAATVAGSPVLTIPQATLALFPRLRQGLSLAVAAGANGTWAFGTVLSVLGSAVTLSAPMGATLPAAPVALANGSARNDEPPVALAAYQTAGAAAVFDPRSGLARGVSVTAAAAGDAGATVTVAGLDIYMQPMAEVLAVAGAGITYGKKAFKYVTSVTPNKAGGGAAAGTFAVGTSDLFGLAMRSDAWEYLAIQWGGAGIGSNAGWVPADTTAPATGTTGDVRGTLQLSAAGPGATFVAGGAPDGIRRLIVSMRVPSDNLLYATAQNPAPLFGTPQFAG